MCLSPDTLWAPIDGGRHVSLMHEAARKRKHLQKLPSKLVTLLAFIRGYIMAYMVSCKSCDAVNAQLQACNAGWFNNTYL